MSKLQVSVNSDRRQNLTSVLGNMLISATFHYGSASDSKPAVSVNLTSNPFSADVWTAPELRPTDRGIRLVFCTDGGRNDLSAEIFSPDNRQSLEQFAYEPEKYEWFSGIIAKLANDLNLHYDRTSLDKWLEQEDPR